MLDPTGPAAAVVSAGRVPTMGRRQPQRLMPGPRDFSPLADVGNPHPHVLAGDGIGDPQLPVVGELDAAETVAPPRSGLDCEQLVSTRNQENTVLLKELGMHLRSTGQVEYSNRRGQQVVRPRRSAWLCLL